MFLTVHVFKYQMPDVQIEVRITCAQIPELCGSAWYFMHTYWENVFYMSTLKHLLYIFPVFIIICPFLSYNSLKNTAVNYYY